MADRFIDYLHKYNGNIRLAVIEHNDPRAAAAGRDSPAEYYAKINRIALTLSLI